MKALVIGAGVAGLSAAIALLRCGWSVDVFEREAALRAEGAGIQLGANAVGALKQLGAFGAIADAARQPEAVRLLDGPTGRALADIPFGRFSEARYGNPNLLLRRADLVAGLAEAAQLAGADLIFSAKVDVADAASGQVSVNGTLMQADLVLGADGLYSRCRELFDLPAPRYTGHIAWRALFRPDSTPDPITRNWMFPDRHIVYYPVGQGDDLAMNLVAFTPSTTPQAEDWDATAPQDALLEKFPDACREVRWLIEATDVIGVWGIYAHQIPNWVSGRLCLIGDAAHPTTPYLAQGAGMALEDAACLMDCLDPSSDVSDRLAQFSAIRKPRTDKVTQQSFRSGAIYHKGGLVRHARNIVLRSSKGARLLKRLDWLYGNDSSTQTGT